MDTRDGRIVTFDDVRSLSADERRHFIPMTASPTTIQRIASRVGRNDPCPRGSGRKFKLCHLRAESP